MTGQFLRTERDGNLAVWWLDQQNERHNKLSRAALDEIDAALGEAAASDDVEAIVVISAKPDTFIVGADVRELQSFSSREEAEALSRRAHDLIRKVSNLTKPIVAAMHGATMGGGLEFALACTKRIATEHASTVFALPEVKLGILPGGGGTQLLPRLVGLQQSLPLLLTGKNTYARPARRMGLVDALIHRPGLLTAAKSAARELVDQDRQTVTRRRMSLRDRLLEGNPLSRRVIYLKAAEQVQKETRGNYPAPVRILECVRVGLEDGLEAGLECEAVAFGDLSATDVSIELVRLFFAKNDAETNPWKDHVRPVQLVGVLGAGLMGSGIAEVTGTGGIDVVVKDQSLDLAAEAQETIYRAATRNARKGAMSRFDRDQVVERVQPADRYEAFTNADLIIEAAPENLELKKRLIQEVEAVTDSACIFASNTSSIPITLLAEGAGRPDQVIGMHYFSPVPKVPLLEIIRTKSTPDWVLGTVFEVGLAQGKTVIVVRDGPGFYTTRVLALYMNEALRMLDDGARVEKVDATMRRFGFPMGPFELFDLVGLDVAAKITDVLGETFSRRGIDPSRRADALVDAGFKGQKSGAGFYRHEDRSRDVNSEVYAFFDGERAAIPEEEVIERLSLTFVNEAARCLEEGILLSARDGDVGAVFGLGFPPFRGGPFRYAEDVGLELLLQRLDAYAASHGPQFDPAPLIRNLAEEGRTFYGAS